MKTKEELEKRIRTIINNTPDGHFIKGTPYKKIGNFITYSYGDSINEKIYTIEEFIEWRVKKNKK